MVLILIREFNSINIGFSIGMKLREIRQPFAGLVLLIAGWGGKQTADWHYGITVSRMGVKNQNDHSGWMLKPTGRVPEPVTGLSGSDSQMDQTVQGRTRVPISTNKLHFLPASHPHGQSEAHK